MSRKSCVLVSCTSKGGGLAGVPAGVGAPTTTAAAHIAAHAAQRSAPEERIAPIQLCTERCARAGEGASRHRAHAQARATAMHKRECEPPPLRKRLLQQSSALQALVRGARNASEGQRRGVGSANVPFKQCGLFGLPALLAEAVSPATCSSRISRPRRISSQPPDCASGLRVQPQNSPQAHVQESLVHRRRRTPSGHVNEVIVIHIQRRQLRLPAGVGRAVQRPDECGCLALPVRLLLGCERSEDASTKRLQRCAVAKCSAPTQVSETSQCSPGARNTGSRDSGSP